MTMHYAKGKMKLEMSQVIQIFAKKNLHPDSLCFTRVVCLAIAAIVVAILRKTEWCPHPWLSLQSGDITPDMSSEHSPAHPVNTEYTVIPSYLLHTANLSISSL